MSVSEWNEALEHLMKMEAGNWVEEGSRYVETVEMMGGNFVCYEEGEFVKLVETPLEAMLFIEGR